MAAGKLNYAYRLAMARFVILRMRFKRFMKRRVLPPQSSAKSTGFSRQTYLLGVGLCLSAVAIGAWLVFSKAPAARPGSPLAALSGTVATPVQADKALLLTPAKVEEPNSVSDRVTSLEKSLSIQQTENASLKELLREKNSVIASMEDSLTAQSSRVNDLENQVSSLEQELIDKERLFAEAESRWEESSTERKVVYNITNIPVGGHVTQKQIEHDVQSATGDAAANTETRASDIQVGESTESVIDTQGYTYQYGPDPSDVDASDPYEQYRDKGGENVGWRGDDYLSDVLESNQSSTDSFLSESTSVGSTGPITDEDVPVIERVPDNQASSQSVIVTQESFFGPGPDRYEDLVEPGMAESVQDTQPLGKN